MRLSNLFPLLAVSILAASGCGKTRCENFCEMSITCLEDNLKDADCTLDDDVADVKTDCVNACEDARNGIGAAPRADVDACFDCLFDTVDVEKSSCQVEAVSDAADDECKSECDAAEDASADFDEEFADAFEFEYGGSNCSYQ